MKREVHFPCAGAIGQRVCPTQNKQNRTSAKRMKGPVWKYDTDRRRRNLLTQVKATRSGEGWGGDRANATAPVRSIYCPTETGVRSTRSALFYLSSGRRGGAISCHPHTRAAPNARVVQTLPRWRAEQSMAAWQRQQQHRLLSGNTQMLLSELASVRSRCCSVYPAAGAFQPNSPQSGCVVRACQDASEQPHPG